MMNRVLVAEDDRAIRESVMRALQMEGYQVAVVTDGLSALVAVSDADLLLLDVMMPGLDGLEVCKVLRAHGLRPADPDPHGPYGDVRSYLRS